MLIRHPASAPECTPHQTATKRPTCGNFNYVPPSTSTKPPVALSKTGFLLTPHPGENFNRSFMMTIGVGWTRMASWLCPQPRFQKNRFARRRGGAEN
jgi:hypothetical protein